MKVKELMDSLKGDCYRFRVHYPEEWEFGLITGATFFGKRGLVLQHDAVNDQKHGIGSVTYWVAVVERAVEDAVMGWLPCDRDGVTEDEEGMVPDDATVAYISTLDGSREERAFNLAKHDYYGFLDYKEDRYTTVYGYMD